MATAILASVDGAITDPADAKISILDEGLVRGDGAFEVLKLYGDHPSGSGPTSIASGARPPPSSSSSTATALEAEIAALLERGGAPDGCLRVIVTRGGRRVLTIEELTPFAPSASIALVELSPSEILAGVKSLSYAANMQASRIAASRGADEAVYIRPDGVLLEAPTSSIFFAASDGDLRTPSLNAGILDSITRDVLIEELPVSQGTYSRNDLLAAKEAFLASTNREIQPISAVEGIPLPIVGRPRRRARLGGVAERRRGRAERRERLNRGPDAQRRAATDLGNRPPVRRRRDLPADPRERPGGAVRRRPRPAARRDGLPRGARLGGVRRPRPRTTSATP